MSNLKSINPMCHMCKGTCWNEKDNFETQKAARKMFKGPIPNDCVNDSYGNVRCPAALHLLN